VCPSSSAMTPAVFDTELLADKLHNTSLNDFLAVHDSWTSHLHHLIDVSPFAHKVPSDTAPCLPVLNSSPSFSSAPASCCLMHQVMLCISSTLYNTYTPLHSTIWCSRHCACACCCARCGTMHEPESVGCASKMGLRLEMFELCLEGITHEVCCCPTQPSLC
jgi:hypothetical protein